ncbi:11434_t:CDS:2 [Paraglomus brasilianum]|uniref:11434_t:CDS:1 n=1 Tax=Paraglomus brasilianum TaxID=144538 RepID=A0A9N9FHK6_9GLOM|nr:11434_t:CDS:2 [Paraglomus brasilianum]
MVTTRSGKETGENKEFRDVGKQSLVDCNLEQLGSFQGPPNFVAEVENVNGGSGTKFTNLDKKFKDIYFAQKHIRPTHYSLPRSHQSPDWHSAKNSAGIMVAQDIELTPPFYQKLTFDDGNLCANVYG